MNILMFAGLIMTLVGIFLTSLTGNNSRFVSLLGLFLAGLGFVLLIKGRRKFNRK